MGRKKLDNSCRLEKELFRKRKATLFNKANILNKQGADVYVVLRRYDRFYTYTSSSSQWPPSLCEIVGLFPQTSFIEQNLIKGQKQSRGSHLGPANFDKFVNIDKITKVDSPLTNFDRTFIHEATYASTETESKPPVEVSSATQYVEGKSEAEEKSCENAPFYVPSFVFQQDGYHTFSAARASKPRKFGVAMPPILSTSPFFR